MSKQEKHGGARSEAWASVHRGGAEWELAARTGCIAMWCFRRSHQPGRGADSSHRAQHRASWEGLYQLF